ARAAVEPGDQGDDRPVAEAQHEPGGHRHPATFPDDETDHARTRALYRHEVDQCYGAVAAFEACFENQRVRPIAPGDAGYSVARSDLPMAMIGGSQKRGEASIGIEARPTQPIERTVTRAQRSRLAIADQR